MAITLFQLLELKDAVNKHYTMAWSSYMNGSRPMNSDVLEAISKFNEYCEDKRVQGAQSVLRDDLKKNLQTLFSSMMAACQADYDTERDRPYTAYEKQETFKMAQDTMESLSQFCEGTYHDDILGTDYSLKNEIGDIVQQGRERLEKFGKTLPTFEQRKEKFAADFSKTIELIENVWLLDASKKDVGQEITGMAGDLLEQLKDVHQKDHIDIQTFSDLSNRISEITEKMPMLEKNQHVSPLFEHLYELNQELLDFEPTSAAVSCSSQMKEKMHQAMVQEKNQFEKHPWDEEENFHSAARAKNIKSFMEKHPSVGRNAIERAKADSRELDIREQRLRMPLDNPALKNSLYDNFDLEKKDLDALSGTGSTEYTRLAKAWKNYNPEKGSSAKQLFEAARDYLQCKKTSPITPEGSRRVEAAAKVMAMAGVRLTETIRDGSYKPENGARNALEDIASDMKIECGRNRTFRRLMATHSPRLIEGGVDDMYEVMGYAVNMEKMSNGKNAVFEGIMAEAKEVNGEFTMTRFGRYQEAKKIADGYSVTVMKQGMDDDERVEAMRAGADQLKADMNRAVSSHTKKQSAPQAVKQNGGPQIGG